MRDNTDLSAPRVARDDTNSDDEETVGRRSSNNSNDANNAVARYSWHGDTTRTRVLLRLVNDTVSHKPEDQRRVTTSEWEIILDAFNREVTPIAESARVLHNRFSNLRLQCKDYHNVVTAQRKGLLDSVDAWVLFIKVNPTLRKWRKKPFEFYDDMVECLRLQGEDLDNPPPEETLDDTNNTTSTNSSTPMNAPTSKRRRTAPVTPPTARTNGVVSISHYPAALRHLGTLGLSLEDRVDAKRFLVHDANAQAFIYMDEAERRFFLQKYCFDRRETQRVEATNQSDDAAPSSPHTTT